MFGNEIPDGTKILLNFLFKHYFLHFCVVGLIFLFMNNQLPKNAYLCSRDKNKD